MAAYGTIQVSLSVELNQAHRWFLAKLCSVSVAMTMKGTGREYCRYCMYVSCSVEKLYAHDTLLRMIRSVCLCVQ